jgi:hypothetical protein
MSSGFSSEELFNVWFDQVTKEYQYGRFLFNNRAEILEALLESFRDNNISIDEARVYKNKVISTLVTKEGAKGQGKYKGWRETVSKDFDVMLVEMYESVIKKPTVAPKAEEPKNPTLMDMIKKPIPKQPLIEVWGKVTFGNLWNDKMSDEAHTFGTALFNTFFTNVMKSDWIKDKQKMPSWAKGVLYGND